jgi:histidinol dehydrogenase
MPARLDIRDAEFEAGFQRFLAHRRDSVDNVDGVVADIIADVRARGDAAIAEYSRRFDRVELTAATFRIGDSAVKTAIAQCEPDALAALDAAAARIGEFHRRQKPADLDYVDGVGIRLGYRWTAIASVGLYVPGGTAAYPSSVLMNAIPARVAGVERLVMVVPTPDGRLNPLVLAAASLAGITEIYRIGGAQAIAALAFGSDTITPVDKIVGLLTDSGHGTTLRQGSPEAHR